MPRKTPFRADSEISQSYNDGIVIIYDISDTAQAGRAPAEELTAKVSLRYAEQKLGLTRYYQSKQVQIEAERVLRVPKGAVAITNQDAARTEDGSLYRITLVQEVSDVYPKALDLTLSRISQGVKA